jgi:uncharacterized membrane protein YoaT (DUF817 family)
MRILCLSVHSHASSPKLYVAVIELYLFSQKLLIVERNDREQKMQISLSSAILVTDTF